MTSAVGPLPRFAEVHVRRALELIAEHKTIGRKQLAKKLGVGEGSMRTILNQLKKHGLITSYRGGHALTAKGRQAVGRPLKFVQVDAGDLTVGEVDVATVVRGAASKVKKGIEQRDEAIKAGADGATVLVFRADKLRFPEGFARVDREVVRQLARMFNLREGDVVIIGTASDLIKAEAGVKAAVQSLR
jgi:DNA-binding MarR family transcriptional regulator